MSTTVFKKVKDRAALAMSKHILRKRVSESVFYAHGIENLGDSMVPWLIQNAAHADLPYSNPLAASGPHLLTIGSILQYATSDCYIWGSGFIQSDSKPKGRPKQVAAVRGPLSQERCQALGIEAPLVFGDPALLTSRFIVKKHAPIAGRIGLVPHFVDWDTLNNPELGLQQSYHFIDIRTSDIENFADEITKCEYVVSTSLHGVILSEAFGVPAVWCEVSDNVVGKGFKFHDYFSGTGRQAHAAEFRDLANSNVAKFICRPISNLTEIQDSLLSVFPTRFKEKTT
ncbi:polysaccharide pyruvyl transferase family protein [Pseudooceanicola sp.]|uniref:polysaccharide pyruvyl transferase family protein n=1 Tax=Pseudooceanicola sp. TaxID=1914328 RepID=UPI00261E9D81|nr:polysaccharide pyruvyl transferase family protein [Pseudooceanicola sp.]MDF1854283.1 polysaccharide pyruvyl transferase family protein [Pseudooceanicola sp.]